MGEEERKVLEEVKKLGEEAAEELAERLKEVADTDPEGSLKLFKAYMSGVRKGYKKLYAQKRKLIRIHLTPRWAAAFEAAKQYSYSQGWIDAPKDTVFARFCVKTVINNIIKRLKAEDAMLVRREEESEQSSEESDKSREVVRDNQR